MAKTLNTFLTMDIDGFAKSFKQSRKIIAKFQRDYGRNLAKIGKRLAVVGVAAGAAFGAFSFKAMQASGEMKTFRILLETVTGSAKNAEKAFKDTFDVFVKSPFYLKPLIKARALLDGFGVKGKKSLLAVASAAAVFARPVEDIALALGSMETRPVRRLGIQLNKVGEMFKFVWRDRGGKAITTVVHGLETAREALIDILDVKFGGALEKIARGTFTGALSTLGGIAWAAMAQIGDGINSKALPMLVAFNDKLQELLQNGYFIKMSAKFASHVGKVVRFVYRLITAFVNLDDEARTRFTGLLKVLAVVAIGFKTGLLQPVLSIFASLLAATVGTVGRMITVFVAANPAVASAVGVMGVAITTAIAGWQIGEFFEEQFDFSGRILKAALEAKKAAIKASLFLDTLEKKEFLGMEFDTQGIDMLTENIPIIGKIWQDVSTKSVDEINAIQRQINLLNKEIAENTEGPDKIAENWNKAAVKVENKAKSIATAIIATFKKAAEKGLDKIGLGDFLKEFHKVTDPILPEIPDASGLKHNMGDAANSAEKMAKALLPLRGFIGGIKKSTGFVDPMSTRISAERTAKFLGGANAKGLANRGMSSASSPIMATLSTKFDAMIAAQKATVKAIENQPVTLSLSGSWA